MIGQWRKKNTLRAYLDNLPCDLAKRYGISEFYSVGQIERTLSELKYSSSFKDYAMVLFLSNDDAVTRLGSQRTVDGLVTEIAKLFFNGDCGFNVQLQKQRSVGNTGHCSIGADPAGASD